MSIIRQDYGAIGTDVPTQMLIAPVLAEMKADRQFAVGDQFIVDSVLYKITTAISVIGTPLVVDSNCEVSDTISQQIMDIGKLTNRTSDVTWYESNYALGRCYEMNGIVYIDYAGQAKTHSTSDPETIIKLPDDLIPPCTWYTTGRGSSSTDAQYVFAISVATDGIIQSISPYSNSRRICFSVAYPKWKGW